MVKNNDNDYHVETRSRKRKYEDTINENNTEIIKCYLINVEQF